MKIRKMQIVEVPVWENDQMTDAKEPRVLVVFENTTTLRGVKDVIQIGSMFLNKGVTLEKAQVALPVDDDYSKEVVFVPKPDSTFFRAVLR